MLILLEDWDVSDEESEESFRDVALELLFASSLSSLPLLLDELSFELLLYEPAEIGIETLVVVGEVTTLSV